MARRRSKKTLDEILPATTVDEAVDNIEAFVKQMMVEGEKGTRPELAACLGAAVDVAEYMRLVRDGARIQATTYLPQTIKAVGEKASMGDILAAKLLCSIVGLLSDGKSGGGPASVLTQINISQNDLKSLEAKVYDT